jgi:glycosyltransferase involved in cell wall biosynthesis
MCSNACRDLGRIGVSLRVSLDVTAIPTNPAGAGRYVVELARHLAFREKMDLLTLTRKADGQRWRDLNADISVKPVAPNARPLRLLWEQISMPAVLNRIGARVHHGPHYTLPERSKIPAVVTIHDMTFFDHPEWHEKAKVKFFQRAIRVATEKAQALVAVSDDTAVRLRERFGDVEVTVIPHGVDHARFKPEIDPTDVALLRSFEIPSRYVAFVGTLEPRKDVPSLLAAFDRVAAREPDLFLVLAGGRGWHDQQFINARKQMKFGSRVLQTGFVPDSLIPPLLRNAVAVAYPSLAEGFGLPALEALACGAPLVTTTGSAMQEVVGDAALLISPGDVEALTEALTRLLNDETEAKRLRTRGPEIAAPYTWATTAGRHEELYRRVAE